MAEEHIDKARFLDDLTSSYSALETLLASLSEEQMITPGVNGKWSVKDNLAHISWWLQRRLTIMQARKEGVPFNDPAAGKDDDEMNEIIYQANIDRPLHDVRTELHTAHQRLVERVQAMSEAELNQPASNGDPVWTTIPPAAHDHYADHIKIIQDWLARKHA
ncbi:ClbS/DfsB family four-helix bundle protein [Ktedonosporobacter rubrisoli]|uniref:ClbS/DfsB family four-helix bundle protein n=1 Tax=Ktedonosporobacter rubrisoli TaxID=2509675 RepID=A0A4P6K1Z0_KTERU|nr:ClbS/DfsB family four-helix bundle protein [Ktedonosporobacter rubrisoli]QBD81486.1 ClbS/DfsB family four-helix bundle protein [Ktedonosporobacter rubrisoli]